MAFFYDSANLRSIDPVRGFKLVSGGSGPPHDPNRQSFHLIHEDWELNKITYVYEYGVHREWTGERDDRGMLVCHREYDADASSVIQFSGGEFLRGEPEWNAELELILKQGIYCLVTCGERENLKIHFTIPDGSDLPPPFNPQNKS